MNRQRVDVLGPAEGGGGQRVGAVGAQSGPVVGWASSPVVVAGVLALVCAPLRNPVPGAGLDPSWRLGLSLIHVRDIRAGSAFVFTYGPLGFLSEPNIVWVPGALLGVLYVLLTAFALYFLVHRCLLDYLDPVPAVALVAAFALVAAELGDAAELAAAALFIWGITLVRPGALSARLPAWIVMALGGAAGLQALVKSSVGVAAMATAVLVVLARPGRLRNLAVVGASLVVSYAGLWIVAGQSMRDLPNWIARSLVITLGYADAMALSGGRGSWMQWLLFAVVIAVLVIGLSSFFRSHTASRALPTIALSAVGAWFFFKAGFVRLDSIHLASAFLGVAALAAALPWDRRRRSLAAAGVLVALLGASISGLGAHADQLRSQLEALATAPVHSLSHEQGVVRAALQPGYRDEQLSGARQDIRDHYAIPKEVVDAVRHDTVHADPWDIAAVWAYDLDWEPVPVFQTYAAYTSDLDQLNADMLTNGSPQSIIRHTGQAVDGRLAAWDSPDYMVALTCQYKIVTRRHGWEALGRSTNACSSPRQLGEALVGSTSVRVPKAQNSGSIVVATFDYPKPAADWLLGFLFRPLRLPAATTNLGRHRFIPGTAEGFHLLAVPEKIAGRTPANNGLDIRRMSFDDTAAPVRVQFWEIPAT